MIEHGSSVCKISLNILFLSLIMTVIHLLNVLMIMFWNLILFVFHRVLYLLVSLGQEVLPDTDQYI